jgi:methylthioxylose transferase
VLSEREAGESREERLHPPVAPKPSGPEAPQGQGSKLEAAAILAVGIAFALGVLFEISPLNGSLRLTGWQWPWRSDLELLRGVAFLLVPLGLIEFVLRKADKRPLSPAWIYVAMLTVGNFLLQMLGMLAEPEDFGLLQRIVQSPVATSYFTDAQRIEGVGAWLRHFDSASLAFHSSTHPPGPVLFYDAFLKLFGTASGALIGGCAVGLLGSLGVAVAYAFAGLWTSDRRTRLTAGALYALLPALSVFFPEFDQVYPIFAMLLVFFWCRSLQSEEKVPWDALCLGAVLFAALFFAYNILTIGAFLAYYAIYWMWRQRWSGAALAKLLRNSAIAAGVCAGGQTILWLATGYNPIASFRHALAYQRVYASLLHRQYLNSILCDPYDFLLGAGILALPLVAAYLYRVSRDFDLGRRDVALSILGLATILTVDLTGVLRGEAARVWLFLQPLVIVPAALELSRFRGRWRTALFATQWLILACLKAKMLFIRP